MNDTIVAIATAMGIGAISIIRVSGKQAISTVNSVFKGKDLTQVDSHTVHYGHILDQGKIMDEVLVSVMRAPKTFTTEDTVEINTHGGIAVTQKVLEIIIRAGARLAEPGEFTKRAFLNGRIDLLEAESVMDMIQAKSEKALELSMNALSGRVSLKIKNIRQKIKELLAAIEVNIDFPEYKDNLEITNQDIKYNIKEIEEEIHRLIEESKDGTRIKDGIQTLIIGKPNVGKSTLLNQLLEEEKAIVTNIPGTTRDIIEGTIQVGGVLLNIMDTAGIRETEDLVEKMGVEKSLKWIEKSDLILLVLDNTQPISKEELELIDKIKTKNHILIMNKVDINPALNKVDKEEMIYISAEKGTGISEIKKKIKELFSLEKLESKDLNYLTNARGIALLKECLSSILDIKEAIHQNLPIDMVEIDLKNIWNKLGEITGETYDEELLDQLFSQFCIGK